MSATTRKDALVQTSIDLRLARHGVIVLLLGLLTGFVIGKFHNPHVGDAAHLVGLIGGFGIIALGPLWPRLNLGRSWSGVGTWTMALSMYLNWLGCVLLGAFGSGPNAPNSTMLGPPLLWDRAGQLTLAIGAWLSLFATIVVLVGLRKLNAPREGGLHARNGHDEMTRPAIFRRCCASIRTNEATVVTVRSGFTWRKWPRQRARLTACFIALLTV